MTTAVRAMVSKCLGALIYQNVDLATQVLESDDIVDQYRDQVFEALLAGMTKDSSLAAPNLHFVLASRHLERIADHATNIAEDVLFWVRGLEVRHGRARHTGRLRKTPKLRNNFFTSRSSGSEHAASTLRHPIRSRMDAPIRRKSRRWLPGSAPDKFWRDSSLR